jgi:16S rRNA (cytosine967-C5)-methyltransferase
VKRLDSRTTLRKQGPAAASGLDSRRAAIEILLRVERERGFADVLLGNRLPNFEVRDRRLITSLVLGVIAWRGRLDYEIAILCGRKIDTIDPQVLAILRLGLYQLRFLTRTAKHAVVDTCVRLAKEQDTTSAASGLINAVMRRATREQATMPDRARDSIAYLAVAYSHPRWMVERFIEWFGADEVESLLAANNTAAPNVIRLNLSRDKHAVIQERLRNEGFNFEEGAGLPETVILKSAANFDSPAYREGLFHLQSEASQWVTRLVSPRAGAAILDCAAAPGGKTTHLAELAGDRATIVAADISHAGLLKVRAVANRLAHRNIHLVEADMTLSAPLQEGCFDAVLLDAPCTGLGTMREHPEIRWRLKPGDPARMAAVQSRMLKSVAAIVRRGGVLVYAVCSLAPQEGPQVIESFLASNREFAVDRGAIVADGFPIPLDDQGYLRTRPNRGGVDGFFAARMKRR